MKTDDNKRICRWVTKCQKFGVGGEEKFFNGNDRITKTVTGSRNNIVEVTEVSKLDYDQREKIRQTAVQDHVENEKVLGTTYRTFKKLGEFRIYREKKCPRLQS